MKQRNWVNKNLLLTIDGQHFPNLKVSADFLGVSYQTLHSNGRRAKYNLSENIKNKLLKAVIFETQQKDLTTAKEEVSRIAINIKL